jgi:DNA-binding winged helix-turn-helix (wHTH) protein
MELVRNAMNKPTNRGERVRFGTFELNVRTGELISIEAAAVEAGSAKVLLREQPFRILRILLERQGEIVTRQEIRQILWPNDTVVEFDRSITNDMQEVQYHSLRNNKRQQISIRPEYWILAHAVFRVCFGNDAM